METRRGGDKTAATKAASPALDGATAAATAASALAAAEVDLRARALAAVQGDAVATVSRLQRSLREQAASFDARASEAAAYTTWLCRELAETKAAAAELRAALDGARGEADATLEALERAHAAETSRLREEAAEAARSAAATVADLTAQLERAAATSAYASAGASVAQLHGRIDALSAELAGERAGRAADAAAAARQLTLETVALKRAHAAAVADIHAEARQAAIDRLDDDVRGVLAENAQLGADCRAAASEAAVATGAAARLAAATAAHRRDVELLRQEVRQWAEEAVARTAAHAALASVAAALRLRMEGAWAAQRAAATRHARLTDAVDALLPLVAAALNRRCDVERLLTGALRDEVARGANGGGDVAAVAAPAPPAATTVRRRPVPAAPTAAFMSLADASTTLLSPSATVDGVQHGRSASRDQRQGRGHFSDLPHDRRLAVLDALCGRIRLRLTVAGCGRGDGITSVLEAALLASAAHQKQRGDVATQTEPPASPPPIKSPSLPLLPAPTADGCHSIGECDCSEEAHGRASEESDGVPCDDDTALLMGAPFGLSGVPLMPDLVDADVNAAQLLLTAPQSALMSAAEQCDASADVTAKARRLLGRAAQPPAVSLSPPPPPLPSAAAAVAVTPGAPLAPVADPAAAAPAAALGSTDPPPQPPLQSTVKLQRAPPTMPADGGGTIDSSAECTPAAAERASVRDAQRLATAVRLAAVLRQWLE
jgi:trimeric autotransporter adhesin